MTIAASAPAAAQAPPHAHPGHDDVGAGGKPKSPKAKALNAGEINTLAELAELIIPRSDTPGAKDAGVHFIIDSVLAGQKERLASFRAGLRPFLKLDAAKRVERLTALHAGKDPFFRTLKDLTIEAYYSTREGLVTELGWSGYTPQLEYKGCTHPEHQWKKA